MLSRRGFFGTIAAAVSSFVFKVEPVAAAPEITILPPSPSYNVTPTFPPDIDPRQWVRKTFFEAQEDWLSHDKFAFVEGYQEPKDAESLGIPFDGRVKWYEYSDRTTKKSMYNVRLRQTIRDAINEAKNRG